MTTQEFSNGFDTLLNSYAIAAGFGEALSRGTLACDEYEKSFYLTKAQSELVISLYTGRNYSGRSFEETEELRRYLTPLVKVKTIAPIEADSSLIGVSTTSFFFSLPESVWFIVYETILVTSTDICMNNRLIDVVPITHDEYLRVKRNPFRGVSRYRALRLDISNTKHSNIIEVIPPINTEISEYRLRYLSQPSPIVVGALGDVSIDGVDAVTECKLPVSLHQKILELAVRLAFESKVGQINRERENS